jgi:hypothetical protein
MLSESARMSSAAEARFRVRAPASVARVVSVVALEPDCDDVLVRLSERSWKDVSFFPASAVSGCDRERLETVANADLVVMVAAAGADASAAASIGRACSDRRVHTAAFVLRGPSTSDEALSKTLAQVRPWSLMVVIAGDEGYVEDILRSFR